MRTIRVAAMLLCALGPSLTAAQQVAPPWHKQAWDPARAVPCDRACLVGIVDDYIDAVVRKEPSGLPLSEQTWFTENTAQLDIGEGILWRSAVEPTEFAIHVADPVFGQVAVQAVWNVGAGPALVVIRLKVERRHIAEVEHLLDRAVAPEAMALLHRPRAGLLADISATESTPRETMIWAAHSYFDALTGDSGAIGAFADECVRHENGYQTVNNPTPGRAAPSAALPPADSEMARLSMMSCAEQIDTGSFTFIKKIWPRRVLIVDERKGLVSAFPLFVMDGTRRPFPGQPDGLPGMITNMVAMETFKIRSGQIHEVEVFPFVTFAYGLGDGWSPATGR